MNHICKALLALLGAGIRDRPAEGLPELSREQWQELFSMAHAHKILPLIFEAAYPLLQTADPALANALKRQVRDQVIGQTIRTGEFLELYRALEAAGITPLVVKGIVCRSLYPRPDHRPSSDEDVLIPPEQFDLCHRTLTALGMTTETPAEDLERVYEVPYRRPGSPLYIELHKQLFPPEFGTDAPFNDFFGDPFRLTAEVEVQGVTLRTMHPCDHLTYLIFHAFKHFLHSGFGIRQICDILLFSRAHSDRIDWEWVRLSCRSIRAEKFAAAIFAIGTRHLGLGPIGPWAAIPVDEMPLLEDVLRAGVYGSADRSRLHSSTITLQAASAQKSPHKGILTAAFPPAKQLEVRYPWLKKQPYLVPIAWADRMTAYLRETRTRSDSSLSDALKIGNERLELLRRYEILK